MPIDEKLMRLYRSFCLFSIHMNATSYNLEILRWFFLVCLEKVIFGRAPLMAKEIEIKFFSLFIGNICVNKIVW